jgi:hypothetical protein
MQSSTLGGFMTDSDTDTVARVLKANADHFERKDVQTSATVGFLLSLLTVIMTVLPLLGQGGVTLVGYIQLLFGLNMFLLSYLVLKMSLRSGYLLLAILSVSYLGRVLLALFEDPINYFGMGVSAVVALLILTKFYPGLGAMRALLAKKDMQLNGGMKLFELVALVLGGGMLALQIFSIASSF